MDHSKQKITTFLMFDGKAEEAMNYYVSVFDQAEIVSIQRYGANEAGAEGTVLHATFSLYGQVFMCIDSSVKYPRLKTGGLQWGGDTSVSASLGLTRLSQEGQPLSGYVRSE
jgi:predicted 3-demethylubiquinone-9 3-methyltransferase (glyoxalase superfamily)